MWTKSLLKLCPGLGNDFEGVFSCAVGVVQPTLFHPSLSAQISAGWFTKISLFVPRAYAACAKWQHKRKYSRTHRLWKVFIQKKLSRTNVSDHWKEFFRSVLNIVKLFFLNQQLPTKSWEPCDNGHAKHNVKESQLYGYHGTLTVERKLSCLCKFVYVCASVHLLCGSPYHV